MWSRAILFLIQNKAIGKRHRRKTIGRPGYASGMEGREQFTGAVKRSCRWSVRLNLNKIFIFLKFDHPIYENDTSPFGKGGSRGIFQVDSLLNPPGPPFSKGGILSILVVISGHKSVR
jgi:hypothetical protein